MKRLGENIQKPSKTLKIEIFMPIILKHTMRHYADVTVPIVGEQTLMRSV